MTISNSTFQTIFRRIQASFIAVTVFCCLIMICGEILSPTTHNYMYADSILDGGATKDVILTKHIYEPGFAEANSNLCSPDGGQRTKLLILVTSAPDHFKSRHSIRLTWGTYGKMRFDLKLAFIIGQTSNVNLQKKLKNEQYFYNDLIIGNFNDTYDNLTLKTMACLEWINLYCGSADYILKTDDDMFINVPNLLYLIKRIARAEKEGHKFYGRLGKKWEPRRGKSSKYYISFEQYENHLFPDFTTGPAYLFSASIVPALFEIGMTLPYIKLEDVYTTGIAAKSLGIKRANIPELHNKQIDINTTDYCDIRKLVSIHKVSFQEMFELWKMTMSSTKNCKKIISREQSMQFLKQIKF